MSCAGLAKLLEYKRKFNTFHCMTGRAAAGKIRGEDGLVKIKTKTVRVSVKLKKIYFWTNLIVLTHDRISDIVA